MNRERPGALDYTALAMVSAGILAFEILLLRVFSFSQWHHFASLAVSLALLGFGSAGTVLTLLGRRTIQWGDALFGAGMLIAAAGMVVTFLLNQAIAVRPLFAVWNPGELARLLLLDFVAFMPFFGGALCIGQVFARWPAATGRLYAANLFGSGIGSLGAAGLLIVMSIQASILTIAVVVFAATTAFCLYKKRALGIGIVSSVCLSVLIGWAELGRVPNLRVSDFKQLSYLLDLPDAEVLREEHGLRSMATEVRSDSIRVAPGLSLQWFQVVPSQDAVVIDADRMVAIPRDAQADQSYREAMLVNAAYTLRPAARTLVLGTSEAGPPLRPNTIWVEPNRQIIDALARRGLTDLLEEARIDDPRHYLAVTDETFDVILFDSAANGGDAMSEETLLTTEALRTALNLLEPGGLLVIPIQLSNPPRYFPKATQLVRDAVGEDAADRVLALRSLQQGVILIANESFDETDRNTLRKFAETWGFDLVWSSDMTEAEANRFHQLDEPLYYQTARAILIGEGSPPDAIQFYNGRGASDLRPYFWHSVKWSAVPGLLKQLGRQGLVYIDWGALLLVVTLVVAGLLAALLILAPLGRLPAMAAPLTRTTTLGYFLMLGIGYLTLEIALLQRAILLFGHPVIAAVLVFTVFLIGSGIGSLTAPNAPERSTTTIVFAGILTASILAAAVMLATGTALLRVSELARVLIVIAALLPLAWTLGRPFPWGLSQLAHHPTAIPWAWGINGFASVLAAPLATLLSVHVNQCAAWGLCIACYGMAWVIAMRWCGKT